MLYRGTYTKNSRLTAEQIQNSTGEEGMFQSSTETTNLMFANPPVVLTQQLNN